MNRFLAVLVSALAICSIIVGVPAFAAEETPVAKCYATPAEYEEATGEKIIEFKESPDLAKLVEKGELPPVEERLPEEPLVVEPFEEIGEYGGTIRGEAHLGTGDSSSWWRMAHEPLVYWDKDHTQIYPNVAKSWEVSDEGATFTFYLREGMKWSDGEPFTADDIMFWFEDIISNEELTPVFPTWLTIGGKPGTVEKVDDYTVRFCFPEPYGFFISRVANCEGTEPYAPKHYLMQFHPKYTPKEELEKLAKEEGFDFWYQLFLQKNDWAANPELPETRAWKTATPLSSTHHIAERNPYYWKIDPAGNQLPYADKWRRELVSDVEMIVMKAVAGELDYQHRHIWNQYSSYTLLMENREKGNYRVLKYAGSETSTAGIYFNQTCKDPVLKSLFQDKTFRRALSLGINRDDINALILMGLGEASQGLLSEAHPAYDEELNKAYTEYDPAEANRMLDSLGLTERDKDGYRLRPDGKTLAVTIIASTHHPPCIDAMQLVAQYWEDLGIKTEVQPLERSLFELRQEANEHEIATFSISDGIEPLVDQVHAPNNRWCPLWYNWLASGGKSGEEPPEEIKRLWEIYQKEAMSVVSEEERNALIREIMELHSENLWIMGTVGIPWMMAVVKNDLRNVPEKGAVWSPGSPGVTRPEQFFFKK